MSDDRLRILFLIGCFGPGQGGHFHSLYATAKEMSKISEVSVVSIGRTASNEFYGMKNYTALKSSFPSPLVFLKLMRHIRKLKVDVIHAFDSKSYFFARVISIFTGIGVLLTKCGGPNAGEYLPRCKDLVLFSAEDMDFFGNSRKHRKTDLHHIPNRILPLKADVRAIDLLKNRLRKNTKVMLRISRFCREHKEDILDTVGLVNRLQDDGIDVQLLLVGAVRDKKVYEEVLNQKGDFVVVTELFFTKNAARIISVADIIIGTGRGAMEAILSGKVLLSPVKGLEIPVLVVEENIDSFTYYNFSSRTRISHISRSEEYEKIRDVLTGKIDLQKESPYLMKYAQENFNVSFVRQRFMDLYEKCSRCELDIVDIGLNFIFVSIAYARVFLKKHR